MISVLMSIYKEPINWIKQSINSILNQTYKDFEFIIVCDNPESKEHHDILDYYSKKDSRILVIYNNENIGLTKSLNKALKYAKGEYIARMDADDISTPNRFELQVKKLSEGFSFVYPHIDYINEVGETVDGISLSPCFMESEFFIFNPIPHPAVMFSSSLLSLRSPLYNEKFKRSQDYELWTLFYLNGVKFEKINETLLHYRLSESQITNKSHGEQRKDFETIRENLILRYLSLCGVEIKENVSIENQLDELYNALLNKYTFKGSISDSLSAIMYLLTYSILPKKKKVLFDYYHKGVFSNFSFRRNIYVILRALGLKTISFYKLKNSMS